MTGNHAWRWKKLAFAAFLAGTAAAGSLGPAMAQTKPEGEMKFALYVTIAPAWFDPGEAQPGFFTPFWMLVALHDALVRPMPGKQMAPALAESWTESPDKLTYEFKLRQGLNFITATRSRPRMSYSASTARRARSCTRR